jgi:hypothetical protein
MQHDVDVAHGLRCYATGTNLRCPTSAEPTNVGRRRVNGYATLLLDLARRRLFASVTMLGDCGSGAA